MNNVATVHVSCDVVSADVLGIVQSVGSIVMIRRKNSNEEIPKRDITIADERCLSLCASPGLVRYWIWSRCLVSARNSMMEMLWDLQSEDSGGEPVEQHGNE
jgi:hypothetical protein